MFDSDQKLHDLNAVKHLQKMVAFQQLAMEKVNDALALATKSKTPTNEGVSRPVVVLYDEEAVDEFVLPALHEKTEILRIIESEQAAFEMPIREPFRTAFISFNEYLEVLKDRTELQISGFTDWLKGSGDHLDATQLDGAETAALDQSILNLNLSIQSLNIDASGFLDILEVSFNDVRAHIGLEPMSKSAFREVYLGGLEGKPARFFS